MCSFLVTVMLVLVVQAEAQGGAPGGGSHLRSGKDVDSMDSMDNLIEKLVDRLQPRERLQAQVKEQDIMDQLIDKLVDRALDKWSDLLQGHLVVSELDRAILAKPKLFGHTYLGEEADVDISPYIGNTLCLFLTIASTINGIINVRNEWAEERGMDPEELDKIWNPGGFSGCPMGTDESMELDDLGEGD